MDHAGDDQPLAPPRFDSLAENLLAPVEVPHRDLGLPADDEPRSAMGPSVRMVRLARWAWWPGRSRHHESRDGEQQRAGARSPIQIRHNGDALVTAPHRWRCPRRVLPGPHFRLAGCHLPVRARGRRRTPTENEASPRRRRGSHAKTRVVYRVDAVAEKLMLPAGGRGVADAPGAVSPLRRAGDESVAPHAVCSEAVIDGCPWAWNARLTVRDWRRGTRSGLGGNPR